MAGVSEMPFRVLARELGAGAAPTELVSAKGLLYGQARSARYVAHAPSEQPFWV
ncbi:MAG: tRNA-dihydrouridine synthase, partial [Clostridia bacterium]|nr:tRNA-dihydrouridine synthase [Deltaproteobacteria bacterium]